MLLSPEVDAIKARMMAVLVKDSERFFDDPREADSLGITVRIACEFFIFLQESSGVPKFDEADYIAGTIRSGMVWIGSTRWRGLGES